MDKVNCTKITYKGKPTAGQNKSLQTSKKVYPVEVVVPGIDSPIEDRVDAVIKKDLQRGRLKRGWYLQILLHEDGDIHARRSRKFEEVIIILEGKETCITYCELLNSLDIESDIRVKAQHGWEIVDTYQ